MKTPLSRLRITGNVEGVSYLLLLGVAMPLKYLAGLPVAVKISGWIHGVLFVGFGFALLEVWMVQKWEFRKVFAAFMASLIPSGTFFLDTRIRKEEQALKETSGPGVVVPSRKP